MSTELLPYWQGVRDLRRGLVCISQLGSIYSLLTDAKNTTLLL